jgi:hypothetical protein
MNAARSGVFAGAFLSEKQYRHIALSELPNNSFHRPHTCAGAFHELGNDGVDGHFGVKSNRRIVPSWAWFHHFSPSQWIEQLEPQLIAWCCQSTTFAELREC